MISLETTFTTKEVNDILEADGFKIGTQEFREERDRRYVPADDGSTLYRENDSWGGDRRQASSGS